MALAGFDPTPLEEMPAEGAGEPEEKPGPIPPEHRPSREQLLRIGELLADLAARDPETDWREKARELAGVPGTMLTKTIADDLIRRLERIAAEDGAGAAGGSA
jgi:hypothetical protein